MQPLLEAGKWPFLRPILTLNFCSARKEIGLVVLVLFSGSDSEIR